MLFKTDKTGKSFLQWRSINLFFFISVKKEANKQNKSFLKLFKLLTAVGVLRALIDFTLSNARRFYSSMRNSMPVKGLINSQKII